MITTQDDLCSMCRRQTYEPRPILWVCSCNEKHCPHIERCSNCKEDKNGITNAIQVKYNWDWHDKSFDVWNPDDSFKQEKSSVSCKCGETKMYVNWIEYSDTGGFCKVTCSGCGASKVLIDDFA
jgi:hypothetical protein